MADSTNIDDTPSGLPLIGYYVDGSFAASAEQLARHSNAILVPITVGLAPAAAVVIDVEAGDYMPWQAPAAVEFLRGQGKDPTVYVSYNLWGATATEFRLRGVAEPHYWIALWDGVAEIPAGAVAKQYANPARTGGHYDLSVVADFWPGVDGVFGPGGGSVGSVATIDDVETGVQNVAFVLNGENPQRGVVFPDGSLHPVVDALALLVKEVGAPPVKGGVADLTLTGLAAIKAELDQIKAAQGAGGGGTVDLSGLTAKVDRLLAELHTP